MADIPFYLKFATKATHLTQRNFVPLEKFRHRNLMAEFIRFKLIFSHKKTYSLFEPRFGGRRGTVRYT